MVWFGARMGKVLCQSSVFTPSFCCLFVVRIGEVRPTGRNTSIEERQGRIDSGLHCV